MGESEGGVSGGWWLGQDEPEEEGWKTGGGTEFNSGDSDGDIGVGIPAAEGQKVMLLVAQSINGL